MLLTQSFPDEEFAPFRSRKDLSELGNGNSPQANHLPACAPSLEIAIDKMMQKELRLARHKLQASDAPFLSKVIYYLQISCFIIQKTRQQLGDPAATNWASVTYAGLIKSLIRRDTGWWKKCRLTEQGGLISDDPVVSELLQPIEEFYQTYVLCEPS